MTPARLIPKASLAELHPPGTALTPRSSRERTRWVFPEASLLETVTGFVLAVLGPMPLICHHGAATEEALEFMRLAGLDLQGDLRRYETEAEAVALARTLASEGWRLAYLYPPPPGADDPAHLLVSLQLYGALNDKANLAEFVAPGHLAPRQVISFSAARAVAASKPARQPVFLKVSYAGAAGGGVDIRYCASAEDWQTALDEFETLDPAGPRLVIEDAIDIHTCWCLSMAITDHEVRYLGAAIQLFGEPGKQIGSLIDPAQAPPEAAIRITCDAVEKARQRGYRGIAGADIGLDTTGHLYVFDLNFRVNSSTPQVLLHDAATARLGAPVSRSVNVVVPGRLGPALDRIRPYAEQGRFIPTRLHDAHDATAGKSRVTGFVVEHSAETAERLAGELAVRLADAGH